MLKQSFLCTSYHDIGFFMLQQHSHHGSLRHKSMYPAQHLLISRVFQYLIPESRPVIIVNSPYTFSYIVPTSDGCIYGQIAAFGMTGRVKRSRAEPCYLFQVILSCLLPRNNVQKA